MLFVFPMLFLLLQLLIAFLTYYVCNVILKTTGKACIVRDSIHLKEKTLDVFNDCCLSLSLFNLKRFIFETKFFTLESLYPDSKVLRIEISY